MMNAVVGIFFDPREPPPPELRGLHGRHRQRAPFRDHVGAVTQRQRQRPQPPPPAYPRPQEVDDPPQPHPHPPPLRGVLPPLSVSLVARIVHDTAKVSVTQTFWNDTDSDIPKGTYTFPLPAGCTVVDFGCRVGRNRIVRGRVKPKREAREAFDRAATKNQPAGLLEQETPEIFTTTLANIPANTKLKAEISFITLLKHGFADNSATTTLTIPTYIASRYSTPPELQHVLTTSTPESLTIQVEVLTMERITSIASKTHNVNLQMGVGRGTCQSWNEFITRGRTENPRTALVELANGSTYLDRDFVLDIKTSPQDGLETPHACMEIHTSFKNHKAVMLTIPPKFMLRNQSRVHDAEVLFVADRSGSMSDKMESLKSAMEFFLRGIEAQYFNVWCFGSDYTYLWPRSKGYSDSTLREALSYVSRYFRSDMGGTELLPALKAIVNARGDYHMTDVVLLTDGEVWRLDETIRFIQQTRISTEGRVRFFALGIGDAVSHELVEGIAKAGGGYAEVIPAANQDGWEDRIVAVLHATLTGHIGPLRVEFDRVEGQAVAEPLSQPQLLEASTTPTRPDLSQSPADISTLSPFLRNRVFILVDSTTSLATLDAINIRAIAPDRGEVVTRVPVKTLTMSDSTIHKLGARALLGDLERGQSWIQLNPRSSSRHTPEEEEEITRRDGEKLGCKWSLVSKWTSFYAIEEVYEAQEGARDPFLDPDDPQIHHITNNDLDLLHPRGVPGQHVRDPMIALPVTTGTLLSEGTEEDEDSTSESDSSENGHNSDSGGDDGGSDHYGDGGGSLGGDTGGYQQGRDSTRDGRPEQERDAADGRGDPQHGFYDGFSRERTHNSSLGPYHDPNFARSNSSTFQKLYPAPSIAPTTTRSGDINAVASTLGTRHPKHVNLHNRFELPNSTVSKEKFEKPVGSWSDSSVSPTEARTSLPSPARRDRPEPTRAKPAKRHISSLFKRPTRKRRSTSIERSIVAESTEKWKYSFASEYDKKGGRDYFAPKARSSTIPLTKDDWGAEMKDDWGAEMKDDWGAEMKNDWEAEMKDDWGAEMKAPSHNPPASTSMVPIRSHAPKSVEDAADEALVRRLIIFQSFDGSFLLNLNDLDELFGKRFRLAVQELQTSGALVDCWPDDPAILAATIAIIIWLEEAFQSCKDLWLLMEKKARDYVDLHVPRSCRQELFAFARERFLWVHIQELITRFPGAAPLSDQSTGRAVSASDAPGPLASRRSLLWEGIKKFRSAKPEAEPVTQKTGLQKSAAAGDGAETTGHPVESPKGPPNSSSSIRQSWQRMKSFRSKTEPRTTPHPETPRQKELLAKEGVFSRSGITSSSKDVSSFISPEKSWIGQKGESPLGEIGRALGGGANPLEMR